MTAREVIEVLRSDPEATQPFETPKQIEQLREEMNTSVAYRLDMADRQPNQNDFRDNQVEQCFDTIEEGFAYLKMRECERWFRDNAKNIFGRFMKRPQVVDLPNLEEILGEDTLTQEHRDLLAEADLIVRGIGRDTQREVFAVLEASWKVDGNDVERARRRAEVLRQYGLHAVPVVGGVETIEAFALPEDVTLFIDGKVHNAPLLR